MASVRKTKGKFTVIAYQGDAKTLLAFNLDKASSKDLAGFTIQYQAGNLPPYYVFNSLQFKKPQDHVQVQTEPPRSSVNAPIHKFRWVHVPGSANQGTKPFMGTYTYTVTPRYFAANKLQALDPSLSVSVSIDVAPFEKGNLKLGFTRGFTQSQAFDRHFGKDALIRPKGDDLLFDTSKVSGTNSEGHEYTFAEEYEWLGFTARERIFELLNEVLGDKKLHLDIFAYDLNEPDFIEIVLALAKQGRVRMILDNSALHHSNKDPKPEDEVETKFTKAAKKGAAIKRGKFGRYAHDKVFIVSKKGANSNSPVKVMTGSTNFSVTGFYVNSNHVLVYDDKQVAAAYAGVFNFAWDNGPTLKKFQASAWATKAYSFSAAGTPKTEITFAPHDAPFVATTLGDMTKRIAQEGTKGKTSGSVLFAVMQVDQGTSPVYEALTKLHAKEKIFSFGISDSRKGIQLYKPGRKSGLYVTGKPINTILPKPFNQVRNIGGVGHQVHHKFVVCGFERADAVVYCGSSNLANGGEEKNGDNLLAIRDKDVATVFAIEALGLVDHFNFLDKYQTSPKSQPSPTPSDAAVKEEWFLGTTDKWVQSYFDPKDLHCVDRELFG
jgi:hypothetical protein